VSSDRIPKIILKYQQQKKRCTGRPLTGWKDYLVISIMGLNRPNSGKDDDKEVMLVK
jgi:hypothetical protein